MQREGKRKENKQVSYSGDSMQVSKTCHGGSNPSTCAKIGGKMELTIDEINNLTKNNDELMARNEMLIKTLEEIRDKIDEVLK